MPDVFRLVLLRHGEAERLAPRDDLRHLTARGRAEAAAAAAALRACGIDLAGVRVGASPYVRARETAEIVAAGLHAGAVATVQKITPDDDPRRALQALEQFVVPGKTGVVVTHMPLIAAVLGLLVEGDAAAIPGVATGAGAVLVGEHFAPGLLRIAHSIDP